MGFCYIKYSVSMLQSIGSAKRDGQAKVIIASRASKIRPYNEFDSSSQRPTLSKLTVRTQKSTSSLHQLEESPVNRATSQLTMEKSMHLISKFRAHYLNKMRPLDEINSSIHNSVSLPQQDQDKVEDIDLYSIHDPKIVESTLDNTIAKGQPLNSERNYIIASEFPIGNKVEAKKSSEKISEIEFDLRSADTKQPRSREHKTSSIHSPASKSSRINSAIKQTRSNRKIKSTSIEPNEQFMINPDCYVQIVVDYIYEKLGIDKSDMNIDLCDENGNLMELYTLKPHESALLKLEFRKTYYVVAYELNERNSYAFVEPLIKKTCKVESDIVLKVKRNASIGIHINKPKSAQSLPSWALTTSSAQRPSTKHKGKFSYSPQPFHHPD